MSRLRDLVRLALAWLTTTEPTAMIEPDFSARDWADLPPHHPQGDCTPC